MTYVLRARSSVKFTRIAPAGFRILSALDQATQACETDLTISCGSEGHPSGDPHSTGEAVDISAAALSVDLILKLKRYLDGVLGPHFTVLYEVAAVPSDLRLRAIAYPNAAATGPHLHLQRKKGTVYPPLLQDARA